MTLLEKAKQTAVKEERPTGKNNQEMREKAELILAWLKGEVTAKQSAAALGWDTKYLQGRLSGVLFAAIRAGVIKAEVVSEK